MVHHCNCNIGRNVHSRGFTLVELLIVVTVIAVLMSILVPAISRVRGMAMGLKCQSNVHALMAGTLQFASDHDSRLPGSSYGALPTTANYQYDWLMGSSFTFASAPQAGTLYSYINSKQVYLCPAMDTEVNTYSISNGRFDYGFFVIFNGAPLRSIPKSSQMYLLAGGSGWYPTPIICQEEGVTVNGYDTEGDHSNDDQISHIHGGGSYYATVDGSVSFIDESDTPQVVANGCHQWRTMGPETHTMRDIGSPYGYWNSWVLY